MRIFYKRLLSIGIAIGVFCALFVFTAGQTRLTAMQLRNSILDADIYKLIYKPEDSYMTSMGLLNARQIQDALPEGVISDLEAYGHDTLVTYKEEPLPGNITGTGSSYDEVMKLEFMKGRYFTVEELENRSKVCIIKSSIYNFIGSESEQSITIKNEPYEIIGVITDNIESSYDYFEGDIFVPVTTLYEDIMNTPESSGLVSKVILSKGGYTKGKILEEIREKVNTVQLDPTKLEIMLYHESEFSSMNQFIRLFLVMFFISLLILVISAFNIVHIATASIMDREREIGLRTALGATTGQIVKQICSEISFCALRGGLLGIAIVGVFNTVFNYHFKQLELSYNLLTIAAGLILATLAGLIASIIPARKAAKLDPIAALREE